MCEIVGKEGALLKTSNKEICLTLLNGFWTDIEHPMYDDNLGQLDKDTFLTPSSIVFYTLRNLGINKSRFNLREVKIIEDWYKECTKDDKKYL